MEKTTTQIEKNVSASFAYVKKDMLMLNDAFSDLHDKVQHLSLNHATLLAEIEKLRSELAAKNSKKVTPKAKKKVAKTVVKTSKPKAKKTTTKTTTSTKSPKKVIETKETVYS
jgi:regulator of replication initiation timing